MYRQHFDERGSLIYIISQAENIGMTLKEYKQGARAPPHQQTSATKRELKTSKNRAHILLALGLKLTDLQMIVKYVPLNNRKTVHT